jgi:hypothetical protein
MDILFHRDGGTESGPADRRQAWTELQEIIAKAHENVRISGVTPDELERMIDETCDEVRYGN